MNSARMKAKVVQVIRTETVEGKGTKESPICRMTRYWTLDGELLSEEPLYEAKNVRTKEEQEEKDTTREYPGNRLKYPVNRLSIGLDQFIEYKKIMEQAKNTPVQSEQILAQLSRLNLNIDLSRK